MIVESYKGSSSHCQPEHIGKGVRNSLADGGGNMFSPIHWQAASHAPTSQHSPQEERTDLWRPEHKGEDTGMPAAW